MTTPRESDSIFIRWTIHRPVTVLVVFVATLVIGIMAYPRIPVQLMPPGITMGAVSVFIPIADGTPIETMEQVTKPLEDLVRTIPGVEEVYSSSGANRCFVRVGFDPRVDTDTIVADIRERVDRAKLEWPDGVDRYFVWRGRMDADMPIYIASVGIDTGDGDVDVNDIFETTVQNRLLAIDGVARVTFWGLIEKRATIDLDNDAVAAHAVPVRELIQRLSGDNLDVTCGKIRDGEREYLVRSIGKFRSFDAIREYPVTEGIRVKDVADVGYYRAYKDRFSRVNGVPSMVVVVHKDAIANTIDVCNRVERFMEVDLESELPRVYRGVEEVEVATFMNQGEIIELSIDSLRGNGAWGGVFAMLVLFAFFRRYGITILVTMAIPFSLLITVIWIYFSKGTFNILSLMGMSLGIGMLVDNSIVVVENIVRKHAAGLGTTRAAIEGVREVGLAVSLATLTTVVVFLPIMFLGDPRFETIYQEIGGPLCLSVLASLVVALIFAPQGAIHTTLRGEVVRPEDRLRVSRLNRWTEGIVAWCLRRRFDAVVVFVALLSTSFLVPKFIKRSETMAEASSRLELFVTLPKNLNLREASDVFARLEAVFDQRREELAIRSVMSWFDSRDGEVQLIFEPGTRVKGDEFFKGVKHLLPRIPDVRVELRADAFGGSDSFGKKLWVYVLGNDLDMVTEVGDRVRRELRNKRQFPEISDVVRTREETRDEVRVSVDREIAQRYGIDAQGVANMLSWSIRGALLPDYETPDREVPFWIRFQDTDKENIDDLREIPVYRAGDPTPVRLENVASYDVYPGPGEIRRVNGRMTVAYVIDAETDDPFRLKRRIQAKLDTLPIPERVEVTMDPQGRGFNVDLESTIFAATLAVFLVFFVMGVLFESVLLPFSVLLSIPFAFFGSMWALTLTGLTLDASGFVGMIMLVGIVVNNAIVLVDTINRRRQGGLERTAAILESVRVRFRPVWMTALTTIFGLLPLALFPQLGEGMDYKSMAVVIIGGLTTSTFFTLFVVPIFYTLLDDLRGTLVAVAHPLGNSGSIRAPFRR